MLFFAPLSHDSRHKPKAAFVDRVPAITGEMHGLG
jgi:hypothetical protein